MKKNALIGLAASAALLALTGAAAAEANAAREGYNTAGTHQFYVWCTGGTASYTTTADGSSAEDAQAKAYAESKSKGKCWPVWQGKVS